MNVLGLPTTYSDQNHDRGVRKMKHRIRRHRTSHCHDARSKSHRMILFILSSFNDVSVTHLDGPAADGRRLRVVSYHDDRLTELPIKIFEHFQNDL